MLKLIRLLDQLRSLIQENHYPGSLSINCFRRDQTDPENLDEDGLDPYTSHGFWTLKLKYDKPELTLYLDSEQQLAKVQPLITYLLSLAWISKTKTIIKQDPSCFRTLNDYVM